MKNILITKQSKSNQLSNYSNNQSIKKFLKKYITYLGAISAAHFFALAHSSPSINISMASLTISMPRYSSAD